jgi:hypothetical protein
MSRCPFVRYFTHSFCRTTYLHFVIAHPCVGFQHTTLRAVSGTHRLESIEFKSPTSCSAGATNEQACIAFLTDHDHPQVIPHCITTASLLHVVIACPSRHPLLCVDGIVFVVWGEGEATSARVQGEGECPGLMWHLGQGEGPNVLAFWVRVRAPMSLHFG